VIRRVQAQARAARKRARHRRPRPSRPPDYTSWRGQLQQAVVRTARATRGRRYKNASTEAMSAAAAVTAAHVQEAHSLSLRATRVRVRQPQSLDEGPASRVIFAEGI